jgi:hypothetical protein
LWNPKAKLFLGRNINALVKLFNATIDIFIDDIEEIADEIDVKEVTFVRYFSQHL